MRFICLVAVLCAALLLDLTEAQPASIQIVGSDIIMNTLNGMGRILVDGKFDLLEVLNDAVSLRVCLLSLVYPALFC
jgi:hypothetical protein